MTALQRARSFAKAFSGWKWRDQSLLAVLVLGIALANLAWIRAEGRGPHWDMARHLWTSLIYLGFVRHGHIKTILEGYYYYPPLVYLAVAPWYLIFGATITVAVSSNILYIGILAFSIYGIGRRLWNNNVGLLSAIFVLASPMLVSQFKEFQLDAPLTSMIAFGLYVLIRTEEFSNLTASAWLGLVIGLGMLTKWTYIFILGLPLVFAAGRALLAALRHKQTNRIVGLGLTGLIAYAVMSLWYITNQQILRIDLMVNGVAVGAREGLPVVGSFAANIWYLRILVNNQLYLVPLLFLIIGLFYTFRSKEAVRRNAYPLLLIAGGGLFFTLLRNKDARYTLPLLIGIAIISTSWVTKLSARWQRWVAGGLVTYCFLAFSFISFGRGLLAKDIILFPHQPIPLMVFGQHGYIIGAPSGEQWPQQEIYRTIVADKSAAPKTLNPTDNLDTIWFNNWGEQYYSLLYQIPFVPANEAGFMLQRTATEPPVMARFSRIQSWVLPDGSHVALDRAIVAP